MSSRNYPHFLPRLQYSLGQIVWWRGALQILSVKPGSGKRYWRKLSATEMRRALGGRPDETGVRGYMHRAMGDMR